MKVYDAIEAFTEFLKRNTRTEQQYTIAKFTSDTAADLYLSPTALKEILYNRHKLFEPEMEHVDWVDWYEKDALKRAWTFEEKTTIKDFYNDVRKALIKHLGLGFDAQQDVDMHDAMSDEESQNAADEGVEQEQQTAEPQDTTDKAINTNSISGTA